MARRRALLEVEYEVDMSEGGTAPQPEKWERVWEGSGVKNVRVEIREDKAL